MIALSRNNLQFPRLSEEGLALPQVSQLFSLHEDLLPTLSVPPGTLARKPMWSNVDACMLSSLV